MGPLPLLLALLAPPPAAAQRVEKVELSVQPPGGQWSAPELRTPQTASLLPLSLLTVPSLTPTPGLLQAPLFTARPETVSAVAPAARILPQEKGGDPARRSLLADFEAPAKEEKSAAHSSDGEELEAGRRRFDGAGDSATGEVRPRDDVPYPPRSGQTARIAGKDYVLGEKFPAGENAFVFTVKDRPGLVVKILKRGAPASEAEERTGLALLAATGLPHSQLVASSAKGSALVKERIAGETFADIRARGGALSAVQKDGLAAFAADLLASGHAADLNSGNLVWEEAEGRWALVDAGLFRKSEAWRAMDRLFYRDQPGDYLGEDAPAFVEAMRAKLGAESAEWKNVLARASKLPPALKRALAALPPALEEALPENPAPGARVVVAGVAYVLDKQIGAGQGSNGAVFRVKDRPGLIVKFPIGDGKANAREAANLRLLDSKRTAHTRLVAASKDKTVLVKTFAEGETARTILDRGPLDAKQLSALAAFAADLVRDGISPDVKPANLVWDAAGERWILVDGGNLGPAGREEIIEWMLHPSQLPGHPSVDRAAFLKELEALLAG